MSGKGSQVTESPLDVLLEELRHEDPNVRVESAKRVVAVAKVLGPVKAREELVPRVATFAEESDDEVAMELAQQLGNMIPAVGGAQHAASLLRPLEALAGMEEAVVRNKAVESLCKIAAELPQPDVASSLLPLVQRLSTGEWFTTRVSACGLHSAAYRAAPAGSKKELRSQFARLAEDETPMVRRAAAQSVGDVAAACETETASAELLPAMSSLARDEQDSVRMLAVEGCARMCGALEGEAKHRNAIPELRRLAEDKSWRVRHRVAGLAEGVCRTLGQQAAREAFAPHFVQLLRDREAEVKVKAAQESPGFLRAVALAPGRPDPVVDRVLPCLKELAMDASHHVRSSLASVVTELASCLGKQPTVQHLLPILLSLTKDEASQVKLNVVKRLHEVADIIGPDLLKQSLLPAVIELSDDRHWRVRLEVVRSVPDLAGSLGQEAFNDRLGSLSLTWLNDHVHAIRREASSVVISLASIFGTEWASRRLLPYCKRLASDKHYLFRMSGLYTLTSLCITLSCPSHALEACLPTLSSASRDPVANVRFNAAKCFGRLGPSLSPSALNQHVLPALHSLASDPDPDVRYYANSALADLPSS